MKPGDLGLPSKFEKFYKDQEKAILDIACSDERFSLLSAPTGAGKSLIDAGVSKLLEARTLVLVSNKGLQRQRAMDFKDLVDIRGAGNYDCKELDSGKCDEGPCRTGLKCDLKGGGCYYYDAVAKARRSKWVDTNYHYRLYTQKFSKPDEPTLGQFDFLVCDEAHLLPGILSDFCAIRLIGVEFEEEFKYPLIDAESPLEDWKLWASEAVEKVKAYVAANSKALTVRELIRLQSILQDLSEISSMSESWITQRFKGGVEISPIWPSEYAERYVFGGVEKVLLMSATLDPSIPRQLGIKDYQYLEIPSRFPSKIRPFVYIRPSSPAMRIRVDYRISNTGFKILVNRIDRILDSRPDVKGVIHCRSYRWMERILETSTCKDRLIGHARGQVRRGVSRLVNSKDPVILVSPAVEEGYDFKGDVCRIQIILKFPFIDTRPPLIKARVGEDKTYGLQLAAQSLVQSVGRGVRGPDDYCETFIMDAHWEWVRNKVQFPKWFKDSWKVVEDVPPKLV